VHTFKYNKVIPKISDYLNISESQLDSVGVFNAYIGIDSLLFLDPHLLEGVTVPEFEHSYEKIKSYYADILHLLQASQNKNDRPWQEAWKRLTFKETPGIFMGYGKEGSHGSGIGPKLALKLVESASEIIKLGTKDPLIFELLGLFEEDFGPDRLSDMTIRIIREDIAAYTHRICFELNIETPVQVPINDNVYNLPAISDSNTPIFFVPQVLLRDLPVALSWEDIGRVVEFNQELRGKINALIAKVWGSGEKPHKRDIKEYILRNPDELAVLLEAYKKSAKQPYDFENDPRGLLKWADIGFQFAKTNPLLLNLPENPTLKNVEEIVEKIIMQFKRNIEVNDLKLHLYRKVGGVLKPLHEKYSQRLFYSVADTYCRANNLDLSAEPNAGNGPVDFKVSSGQSKVLVEIKLTSNPNLAQGLTEQLGAYKESEDTPSSMYVVIKVTQTDNQTNKVLKLRDQLVSQGKVVPKIFVIDATTKPSASKRKLLR